MIILEDSTWSRIWIVVCCVAVENLSRIIGKYYCYDSCYDANSNILAEVDARLTD